MMLKTMNNVAVLLFAAPFGWAMRASQKLLAVKESSYLTCKDNLLDATSNSSNNLLDKESYVNFIGMQSRDVVYANRFSELDLALIHIYWDIICTVNSRCTDAAIEVKIDDILDHRREDGTILSKELCDRVNFYLYDKNILTYHPTLSPTIHPSMLPSPSPSNAPTDKPSEVSSTTPSWRPTFSPSQKTTESPSEKPSPNPSHFPSKIPTQSPSAQPTELPTDCPSFWPTATPTSPPSITPSDIPLVSPTRQPSPSPFEQPSASPTLLPSKAKPTLSPTATTHSTPPTEIASGIPTDNPLPYQKYPIALTFSIQYPGDEEVDDSMNAALDDCVSNFVLHEISNIELDCTKPGGLCPYSVDVDVALVRFSKFVIDFITPIIQSF